MNRAIYEKDNYTNQNINYIKNNLVTEYDISSAGLSILTDLNYFSDNDYNDLMSMDKLERNIIIGKELKKNNDMNTALMNGFAQVRAVFFEQNNIQDHDVLSIKKDAIFLINKDININGNISKHVTFNKKNTYNAYINIGRKEHYLDIEHNKLIVKKYPELVKERHKDYLFKLLKDVLFLDTQNNKDEIYKQLAMFKYKFVIYNLEKEYYRSIKTGNYEVRLNNTLIELDDIHDNVLEDIVTGYNMEFILSIIETLL